MAPKTRGLSRGATAVKRKRSERRPVREPSPSSDSSTPPASPTINAPPVDHLAGRIIAPGRKVDFELLEEEGLFLGRQIREMGWETLCLLDCPSYPSLIVDFYKNISRGDNGLVSSVRGRRVNVSMDILSRLLNLPRSGPSTFSPEDRVPAISKLLNRDVEEFEEVQANQLTLELRLLHNICSRILFPKAGRFDYVSERDVFIMDAVVNAKPINLPCMMIWYMADCASKKKSCLPYGMVLTHIFRSQGVMISDSEPKRELRHTDYYTLATIHRMGFIKRNGQWERKAQTEARAAEAEAPGPSERHHSPEPPHVTAPPSPSDPTPAFVSIPTVTQPQSSASTSSDLLEQMRTIFRTELENFETRIDNKRKEEIEQLKIEISQMKENINEIKEEITSRLDLLSYTIGDSVKSFSTDLHRIFDRMEGIADGSASYINAKKQLRDDIHLAVTQIEAIIESFKKNQKDDIMEVIGHLKKIVFKHT